MTVVDSSAVVAILRQETDADRYLDAIDAADVLRMSAANHLEAAIVIDSARDPVASRRFGQFIEEAPMLRCTGDGLTPDPRQPVGQAAEPNPERTRPDPARVVIAIRRWLRRIAAGPALGRTVLRAGCPGPTGCAAC